MKINPKKTRTTNPTNESGRGTPLEGGRGARGARAPRRKDRRAGTGSADYCGRSACDAIGMKILPPWVSRPRGGGTCPMCCEGGAIRTMPGALRPCVCDARSLRFTGMPSHSMHGELTGGDDRTTTGRPGRQRMSAPGSCPCSGQRVGAGERAGVGAWRMIGDPEGAGRGPRGRGGGGGLHTLIKAGTGVGGKQLK